MAILLTSTCPPVTAPPEAGYSFRGSQGGCVIVRKNQGPANQTANQGQSIPAAKLGHMLQREFNRAMQSQAARQWAAAISFDKASFESASGTVPIHNLCGQLRDPNGFSLFMHFAKTSVEPFWLINRPSGTGLFPELNYQVTPGDTEPDAPIITAVTWDGVNTPSITVANYTLGDVAAYAMYATPPRKHFNLCKGVTLIGCFEPIFSGSHIFDQSVSPPHERLKPWPKDTVCQVGLRIWDGAFEFFLPSPIGWHEVSIG